MRQLCTLLRAEPTDNIARQNALGALQKLSLRRAPQNAMISADVRLAAAEDPPSQGHPLAHTPTQKNSIAPAHGEFTTISPEALAATRAAKRDN